VTKKWKYNHFYAFLTVRRVANVAKLRLPVNIFFDRSLQSQDPVVGISLTDVAANGHHLRVTPAVL
jgi:hypothetical protein